MENVEQRVKKIIAEQLGVNEAEIKNESSFVDDLGADSLDTVELVMALEEEFETEIPDEEAEKITTVQQAVDYIKAHVEGISREARSVTRRRVVVTGLGIVSPIGNTVAEAWDNALAGKSGITRITRFDPVAPREPDRRRGEGLRRRAVHVAEGSAPHGHLHPLRHGGGAAGLARGRRCRSTPQNAERVGINFGSGIGGLPLIEAHARRAEGRTARGASRRSSSPAPSST